MEKKLDLSKSVYDLVKEYPEVIDIMKGLGFSEITNKVMLNSVGKIMTIPKGAKMKGVSMIDIVGAFMKAGFTLEGEMPHRTKLWRMVWRRKLRHICTLKLGYEPS